ncbi:twin-arginine translocation pathway signal [Catenulispora acidiphila DSM 44928]|uniref:Twin-arginine translocation pathway signal n=1 Tax=Catenulispora acidiphila (strain DSM 44928 / JCM 14897 / NBRC 102108 / NRRL B-24433 / ID139908) TaxID=479433 RepID=C7QJT0_CATAD|nr:ABC transporter substrate-binding protein [Catenulispora acidiphila]ACU73168.1 twin-arginine translocation pathway signal [Catenulispora acidiphila DSM 44928]
MSSFATVPYSRRGFLGLVGTAALAAGCGSGAAGSAKKTTKLRYQGSVGTVTPPELAADLGYLGPVTLDWVGNTTSGPQDIQSAATGQTDFGGAFNGAVAKLHSAGAPITAVISYYGVDQYSYNGFYTLEGSPIASAPDLFGKKVGMNTLGAHYEAVLDIYLSRNGVSDSDAKKVEPLVVPPVNTEQSLRAHQIDVATLGGILRDKALADGGVKQLFTDYQLLGTFSAGTYVFRNDFLAKNPDTVHAFTSGVGKAIEWARTTPLPEVVDRFTKIIKARGRNEDTSTLKYFKSYGIAGTGGVVAAKEFDTWITWLEQQGQIPKGKVKATDVYTNKYNSFANGGS